MRFDGIWRAGLAVLAMGTIGCGVLGGLTPVPDKDTVADAQKAVDGVKAEVAFLMGIATVVETKVDELLHIDEAVNLGRVKWGEFRQQLKGCWEAPMEASDSAVKRSVNAIDAAKQWKNRATLHEIKAVKDTAYNAVNSVKKCPQALTDKVEGFPAKAKDEAVQWAHDKLDILNELRVLLKEDVPKRATKLAKMTPGALGVVAKQIAEAKGLKATAEKLKNTAALKKYTKQEQDLTGLQTDLQGMADQITKDASGMGKKAADLANKVTAGLGNFGSK